MISIYIQIFFMIFVFSLSGLLFQRLFLKKGISFWLVIWLGMATLTAILGFTHLFFATNVFTITIITLLLASYALFDHKKVKHMVLQNFKKSKMHWSLVVVFVIILFLVVNLVPGNLKTYDTGLYHDQYVQWVEDYPAILGLSNFFINLGFNSSWFITNAFFDNETYYVLNAFTLLLFIFSGLVGMGQLFKGKITYSTLFQSAFVLFSPFFIRDIPSLSNDIANSMLILTVFLVGIQYFEKKSEDKLFIISLLSLFGLTVKLSAIPVGLLVLFVLGFWWVKEKKFPLKTYGKVAILSAAVLIPWVLRAIIVTGYLIFPVHQLDVLDVEWKLPHEEAYMAERWIESWAKIPNQSPDVVLDNGISGWLPTWIANNSPLLIIKLLLISIVLFGIYSISAVGLSKSYLKNQWPVIVSALFCLLFWFLKAPDVRFGYGFIVTVILVCLVGLISKLVSFIPVKESTVGILISVLLLLGFFAVFFSYSERLENVGYPPISELAGYRIAEYYMSIGEYDFYIPSQTDQCFNVQELCSPTIKQGHNISFLGDDIRDGFKRVVN